MVVENTLEGLVEASMLICMMRKRTAFSLWILQGLQDQCMLEEDSFATNGLQEADKTLGILSLCHLKVKCSNSN
jgi:hypothetical protein